MQIVRKPRRESEEQRRHDFYWHAAAGVFELVNLLSALRHARSGHCVDAGARSPSTARVNVLATAPAPLSSLITQKRAARSIALLLLTGSVL